MEDLTEERGSAPAAGPFPPSRPDAPGGPGRPPEGPGLGQRIASLFSSPARAFRPPIPTSMWLVPLVALSLMQTAQSLLLRDLYMARVRSTIESNEDIPDAQKEKILAGMEESTAEPGREALQVVSGTAGFWIVGYLIPAALYLVGLNFVLGGRARFRDVFAVTAFSGLIQLVREAIRTPLILARGNLDVYTGPAALAAGGSNAVVTALNMFDVFELYRLVLLTLGFSAITAMPPRRTAYPVIVVWLLYGLAGVGCMLSPIGKFMR